MEEIATIRLDIAKSVFQVHAVSATGMVVVRRQLKRVRSSIFSQHFSPAWLAWKPVQQPTIRPGIGQARARGAAHAALLCEAVVRPTLRFVPVKTEDQQPILMLQRTRLLFIRQRTTLINAIRAHLAEFGIVAGIGRNGLETLLDLIGKAEADIPTEARLCLTALARQLDLLKGQFLEMDRPFSNGISPAI